MLNSSITYRSTNLDTTMYVEKLFTIHYFEHFRDCPLPGEKNDFWKIIYLDSGELILSGDLSAQPMTLHEGQILLIPPNVYHELHFGSQPYIDLFMAGFSSSDPTMECFVQNPVIQAVPAQRDLIVKIIAEARQSFLLPLSEVQLDSGIRLRDNVPFGSLRMIQNALESLLILLYRGQTVKAPRVVDPTAYQRSLVCVKQTVTYLKKNLYNHICMEDVCQHVGLCASSLQREFSRTYGHTVMSYLATLRVEEAKFLIRRRDQSFTEIAEKLCFCSVHHFSRRFRQITGQSPSEYARSMYSLMGSGTPQRPS